MAVCLVTGGAGFIGSHLVDALLARGDLVRVLDNFSTGTVTNLAPVLDRIELVLGDLANLELVRQATAGVELVFHQAAQVECEQPGLDPLAAHHLNTVGTRHLLIAARDAGVRRVIYASSAAVYGRCPPVPLGEEAATQPLTPYAMTKLTGEQDCVAFTSTYGLDTVRLRYFNVFGPRQSGSLPYSETILRVLKALLAGRSPQIQGDGLDWNDYVYVDDVVHANLLVAEARRVAGRVYNIGRGRPSTSLEVLTTANTILGTRIQPTLSYLGPRHELRLVADISRAEIELGFCPSTDLATGLRRCIETYTRRREQVMELKQEPLFAGLPELGEEAS
jgi:UDP-glucose 4-epimerase